MLILLVTRERWLSALGGYLVAAGPPSPADMIVVLAGDYTGGRILQAGELVQRGFARQALISGPDNCCYGTPESDLAIAFATKHGYPESDFISFPNPGLSTREEAVIILSELRKRGVHAIDLVTSNFHTRRSGNVYRWLAPDLEIHVVAAPDRHFTPEGWWKIREGRKIFFQEWMKTIANWLGI